MKAHPSCKYAPSDLDVHTASTLVSDVDGAVRVLAAGLGKHPAVVFCFVSPAYDLERLGPALAAAFPSSCVVGCTTSGQIGANGYQPRGITATSFGDGFSAESFLIEPLNQPESIDTVIDSIRERLGGIPTHERAFGFLLVDGLSMLEERLSSALYAGVGRLPIIGGSAGDDLNFSKTFVLANGQFKSNAAVLTVVRTTLPFAVMKVMHHVPTSKKMVITAADPDKRLVEEINGEPAAKAYAELVGVPVEDLGPRVFSRHPIMLRIADRYYIRSIQQIEEKGAIRFFCAIERGLVMTLAEPAKVMDSLREAFDKARQDVGAIRVVLGCDCILRRLELEEMGMADEVGRFLADAGVIGFSTYGEQLDGLHVNQTFTGIALGAK